MTWLLNHYRHLQAALAVGAAALFGAITLWKLPLQGVFSVYFGLMLVWLVLGGRWLSRAVSRGMVEFYRDCDPGPMLENCERLLARAGERRGGWLMEVGLNRSALLLARGRREEAGAELDRLEARAPRRAGATAVTLRWNRAELNLEEGRLQGMEGELEAISAMARRVRVPSPFGGVTFPELMDWHVERGRCLLLLRTAGPVPELLPRLEELLDDAPCTLYQVQAIMDRGEYHLARGETDQAPQLAMGARARNKLAHLGAESEEWRVKSGE